MNMDRIIKGGLVLFAVWIFACAMAILSMGDITGIAVVVGGALVVAFLIYKSKSWFAQSSSTPTAHDDLPDREGTVGGGLSEWEKQAQHDDIQKIIDRPSMIADILFGKDKEEDEEE